MSLECRLFPLLQTASHNPEASLVLPSKSKSALAGNPRKMGNYYRFESRIRFTFVWVCVTLERIFAICSCKRWLAASNWQLAKAEARNNAIRGRNEDEKR